MKNLTCPIVQLLRQLEGAGHDGEGARIPIHGAQATHEGGLARDAQEARQDAHELACEMDVEWSEGIRSEGIRSAAVGEGDRRGTSGAGANDWVANLDTLSSN